MEGGRKEEEQEEEGDEDEEGGFLIGHCNGSRTSLLEVI